MALCMNHVLKVIKIPQRAVLNYRRYVSKLELMQPEVKLSACCFHTTPFILKRRKTAEERKNPKAIEYPPKAKGETVDVWRNITIGELANVLNRDTNYVTDLFLGNIRGRHTIISDIKELQNAIRRGGKRMRIIGRPDDTVEEIEIKDVFRRPPPAKSELKPRPPIVTVMGHVDHGKTTLLDALRHSSVVDQEFGGITQHIGAFAVKLDSGAQVTFLDTPGHAAFSAMRARGANVTDIIVLVVAADDGVMQQTVECIEMARRANVPMLVAINKIDAPKADIEGTERLLMQYGIQLESQGGDTQAVHISALKRINLKQLTEALALQAELLELGGDDSGPIEAVVIESRLDRYKGRLCTVVVQRGTLKKGAILVADTVMAKVRNLRDSNGVTIEQIGPGYPVEIEGWKDLPPAGELVLQVTSEKQARSICKFREGQKRSKKQEEDYVAIEAKENAHRKEYKERLQLKRKMGRFKLRREGPRKPEIAPDDGFPHLHMVLKTDVDGTLEAILETLSTYNSTQCKMDIIHFGVGPVTENDVELAEAFKGTIYTFNVESSKLIDEQAQEVGVNIKHYNVIYKLINDIKEDITVLLPEKRVENILGEASVLQQFIITEGRKKLPVAGCQCKKGVLKRKSLFRVLRNDQVIHEGSLSSMRYLKDEMETIKENSECGLQFADKSVQFEVNDVIICYEIKMESQALTWDPGF